MSLMQEGHSLSCHTHVFAFSISFSEYSVLLMQEGHFSCHTHVFGKSDKFFTNLSLPRYLQKR